MLENQIIETFEPDKTILDLIKDYKYTVSNGEVRNVLKTNLQIVNPITYIIKYPTAITILEYKVTEISGKPFYIKEHNQKYSLKEIKRILINLGKN